MSAPVCRSCGARVMWARTVNGKSMPLDPVADDNGNITLSRQPGEVAPLATVWPAGGAPEGSTRFVSHFATCPNAGKHRRSPQKV